MAKTEKKPQRTPKQKNLAPKIVPVWEPPPPPPSPPQPHYTALMSMGEAAKALGIPGAVNGPVYAERLLKVHMLKHYAFLSERGYPMLDAKGIGVVAKGGFVENATRCELCRPALAAARKPDAEVGAKMAITPQAWDRLTAELRAEAERVAESERIGG